MIIVHHTKPTGGEAEEFKFVTSFIINEATLFLAILRQLQIFPA